MKKPQTNAPGVDVEELAAELFRQVERVGADMRAAFPQLREIAPATERRLSEDEVEVGFTIDASGMLETLRTLADDAGTDAFVVAYNSSPYRAAG